MALVWLAINVLGMGVYLFLASSLWVYPEQQETPGGPGQYRLTLAHQAEGRGGNIHDPFSVAKYKYRACDMIFVNSTVGRVEGQHIRLSGATGPFRGFISFEGESATVQFEMLLYGGPQEGEFKPYHYNGTYPTKAVSMHIADIACGKP